MRPALLDVNALLALLDPRHVFHEPAHRWFGRRAKAGWRTCGVTLNGVIRIASQPSYPNHLGTPGEVAKVVGEFLSDPRHEFLDRDVFLTRPGVVLSWTEITPAKVTDVYLLSLAVRAGAVLASFDRRIPARAVKDGESALEIIPG